MPEEELTFMPMEPEFKTDYIGLKDGNSLGIKAIKYEWGMHQMGDDTKLVLHFFAHQGRSVPLLMEALRQFVATNEKAECSYTEEFDGHDLIIHNVEAWKIPTIKRMVITWLSSWMKEL